MQNAQGNPVRSAEPVVKLDPAKVLGGVAVSGARVAAGSKQAGLRAKPAAPVVKLDPAKILGGRADSSATVAKGGKGPPPLRNG